MVGSALCGGGRGAARHGASLRLWVVSFAFAVFFVLGRTCAAAAALTFSPASVSESVLRSTQQTVTVRLPTSVFQPTLSTTQLLWFVGNSSGSSTASTGWNAVLRPRLSGSSVAVNGSSLTITVPAASTFEIPATETVTFVVPGWMIVGGGNTTTTGAWLVVGVQSCSVSSPLLTTAPELFRETDIIAGGAFINITLVGTIWSPTLTNPFDVVAMFTTSGSVLSHGWQAEVLPALQAQSAETMRIVSSTFLVIQLPPIAAYTLDSYEHEALFVSFSQALSGQLACPGELRVFNKNFNVSSSGDSAVSKTKIWGMEYLTPRTPLMGLRVWVVVLILLCVCCSFCVVGGGIKNRCKRKAQVQPELPEWDPEAAVLTKARSSTMLADEFSGRSRSFRDRDRDRSGGRDRDRDRDRDRSRDRDRDSKRRDRRDRR
eukprot:a340557_282.p1 GENE.a340557_282~~a340557_282.p1  ORF type:complete len:461 (+),score=93.56 a340557_282:93-1385(+)